MRALVTGGCGFIGGHLVQKLFDDGHDVRVLDNLSTGRSENIENLIQAGSIELIRGQIQDRQAAETAMSGRTHVFHLAALADIVPSIVSPATYFDVNVNGTAVIAEAARQEASKNLFTQHPRHVMAFQTRHQQKRRRAAPPVSLCIHQMAWRETIKHWGQVYGMPFVSLRLFNVYGPRSRTSGTYGAVFGVFLAQKLAGKPMTIVGDGMQSRDFTFVTDVVSAFITAAQSDLTSAVMNVGSGGSYPVNLLAELLGGATVHIPERPGEPDVTLADTTRIRTELGWNPSITFEEGVATMLDNIEYWRDAPIWDPDSISDATELWFKHLGSGS